MILPSCSICDSFAADTMPTVPENNRIIITNHCLFNHSVTPFIQIFFNNLLKVPLSSLPH